MAVLGRQMRGIARISMTVGGVDDAALADGARKWCMTGIATSLAGRAIAQGDGHPPRRSFPSGGGRTAIDGPPSAGHDNWPRVSHGGDNPNSDRTAAAMRLTTSSQISAPFAAVAPRAEDSTPLAGTHSVRVGYMS